MNVVKLSVWYLSFVLMLFIGAGVSVAFAGSMQGLRGGMVLVLVPHEGGELTLRLASAYGWDESVQIYSPDGRLIRRVYQSTEVGAFQISLIEGGLHWFSLPRSLEVAIDAPGMPVALLPLRYETSLTRRAARELFFRVPEGEEGFSLSFTNRIGARGDETQLLITSPLGDCERLSRVAFSPATLKARLGLRDTENQMLSEYSPQTLPEELSPTVMRVDFPTAGMWKLELDGGESGVWLDGVPGLLASNPEDIPPMEAALVALPVAKASVGAGSSLERVPFLGAVGNFDPIRYSAQRQELGIEADQIFLWPPRRQGGELLTFPLAWAKPSFPQMHTMLVLRGRQAWMKAYPDGPEAGFAAWAADAVKQFIRQSERELQSFTVQIFSEPNLEMELEEYCRYVAAVVARFEADPELAGVRLGAPALGSGEERDLVDWRWVSTLLAKHGNRIAAVCWNNYRLRNPEDSAQLAHAIEKTRSLIQEHGLDADIFIGGINRQGGLAASELFTEPLAGIWWAAMLASAINSGELDGIWHFSLADSGVRQKGLLTDARSGFRPKMQSLAHQAFVHTLAKGEALSFFSDHNLIDGVVVQGVDGRRYVLLLNKGWLFVEVFVGPLGQPDWPPQPILPPGAKIDTGATTITLPPRTLVAFSVTP